MGNSLYLVSDGVSLKGVHPSHRSCDWQPSRRHVSVKEGGAQRVCDDPHHSLRANVSVTPLQAQTRYDKHRHGTAVGLIVKDPILKSRAGVSAIKSSLTDTAASSTKW